jgi:hypothetical protein
MGEGAKRPRKEDDKKGGKYMSKHAEWKGVSLKRVIFFAQKYRY